MPHALVTGNQQIDQLVLGGALRLVGFVLGAVDRFGDEIDEGAQRFDRGLLRHQHPAHVGVVDDGRRRPRGGTGGSALAAVLGVGEGPLVGPPGDAETLDTDEETGVVHHREHVAHALVGLADQVALGQVEVERAGRTGVDAELLFDR